MSGILIADQRPLGCRKQIRWQMRAQPTTNKVGFLGTRQGKMNGVVQQRMPSETRRPMTVKFKPIEAKDTAPGCAWCENRFTRRFRGSPQRFCSARCRSAFWSALRRFGERALASGALTIADLQNGQAEACAIGAIDRGESPATTTGPTSSASPEALARFVIEIPRSLLHAPVFRHCELRHDRRDDEGEILGALRNIGRSPWWRRGRG